MKHITILFIIYLFSISSSCKKEKTTNPISEVFLRDKSLSEIKTEVRGNWKIHYKYGGLTGNIKTQMQNSFFKVLNSDSIYLTLNNILFANDVAIFQRQTTNFGYSAFVMNFTSTGGTPYAWIVDYKINDSLVLNDDFPNGNAYVMTRIP